MLDDIRSRIDEIKSKIPDWEEKVLSYLKREKMDELESGYMDSYWSVMDEMYESIKNEGLKEEDVLDLFSDELKSHTKQLLGNRLKSFYAFAPIRNLNKEKKFQAEQLLDSIWEQYVLRFNPLSRMDNSLGFSDKQVEEIMMSIDGIAMSCISKLYNYEGIINEIQERTGLNDEWASFLARKVEKDYTELRFNYIVTGITRLLNKM